MTKEYKEERSALLRAAENLGLRLDPMCFGNADLVTAIQLHLHQVAPKRFATPERAAHFQTCPLHTR